MEKLLKAFFIIILILGLVILLNHNLHVRDRGLCIKQQKMLMEQKKKAVKLDALMMRPQCGMSGNYLPQQCDFATQSCWCVDEMGRPIPGTQTPHSKGQPIACPLNWFEQAFLVWQLYVQDDGFASIKPKPVTIPQAVKQ